MTKLRAALYIRVSTLEQSKNGYSVGEQKERLTKFANAKDYTIVNTYVDPGFSGTNLNRPAIQRLTKDIDNHNIDAVFIWKLDRLSRSQKDTLFLIEEVLNPNKVALVSMNESLDSSTPFGIAMVGMMSVFAQLEVSSIVERSKMGREARAKAGYYHGGGNFKPLGYDYVNSLLIINEYESMVVKEIFRQYLDGNGTRKIIMNLHDKYPDEVSTRTRIKDVLKNPLYVGKITFNGIVYDGVHEPVISQETFDKAQELISGRKKYAHAGIEQKGLLNGKLYCGICGARYYRQVTGSKKYRYVKYACSSKNWSSPKLIKDRFCDNDRYNVDYLEERVIHQLKKLTLDELSAPEKQEIIEERATLESEIKSINSQMNKLIDLFQFDSIPIDNLNGRVKALTDKKERLENQLQDLKQNRKKKDVSQMLKVLKKFDWDTETTKKKIEIINEFVDKVVVKHDKVDVYWLL
jgi:site-specific DNA recombinase